MGKGSPIYITTGATFGYDADNSKEYIARGTRMEFIEFDARHCPVYKVISTGEHIRFTDVCFIEQDL